MLKQQKGITLITLVITIVILIILAGITINLSLSDNGLFQKTKDAKAMYQNAQANETSALEQLLTDVNAFSTINEVE